MLETLVQRCEVPAGAFGTDDPEPALPLVERETPPDAEPRGSAVAVELAVAEGAGAIHQSLVTSGKPQVASRKSQLAACGLSLLTLNALISTSVSPFVTRSAIISP